MTEATGNVLRCENCGAPAAPGDRSCSFCSTPLSMVGVGGTIATCGTCGSPLSPSGSCPRCEGDPTFVGHMPH